MIWLQGIDDVRALVDERKIKPLYARTQATPQAWPCSHGGDRNAEPARVAVTDGKADRSKGFSSSSSMLSTMFTSRTLLLRVKSSTPILPVRALPSLRRSTALNLASTSRASARAQSCSSMILRWTAERLPSWVW